MSAGLKRFFILKDKKRVITLIKYGTLLMVLTVFSTTLLHFSAEDLRTVLAVRYFAAAGAALLGINIGYYAFLLILAYMCYRPRPALPDRDLPGCTVIVPAYNEGKAVLNALDSVLASDYPADKLEILAIDDGSDDDTWSWIQLAASRSGGRITPFRLKENGGKRHALYFGIRQSKAEVIVTVDSDSVVAPDTLRRLNSPFIDPKIAGVAGNIRTLNLDDGLLPRMMDVNFVFGFEVTRSAQSVLGSVFCTPGALSAYRREALLPVLDRWVNQTFLGAPAHIAEDRALATFLLAEGRRIVFQRNAVAHTILPADYRTTCKMLLRWGRGDVRETCSMYRFAFRRLNWFQFGIQLNLLVHTIWIFVPLLLLPLTVGAAFAAPVEFLQAMVLGLVAWSSVPALVYCTRRGNSEAVFAYTFAVYKLFFLFWLAPYCLISVRNSKWMTRGGGGGHLPPADRRKLPSANRPAA
ncbi:MAG: glycosyltransferase family 2 protein [Lentisphaeria bacterium]|nr:glycosyltransferase family 2 protein [Lentisphaeria bacterium]